MTSSLSSNYLNDNYIQKEDDAIYNYENMDETDHTPKKSLSSAQSSSSDTNPIDNNQHSTYSDRSKLLYSSNKNARLNRPGQAIQIRTELNGTRTIDHEDEVGECKISTITFSSDNKSLEKKIEYISDSQLDKLSNGIISHCNDQVSGKNSYEALSAECLPTTTKRSQNDLIQFVFTSTGIRVISDKEYVV